MPFSLIHLRRSCWLALVAALALALLPTVSHALVASRGHGALVEVCTTQSERVVALGEAADDHGVPVSAGLHLEHCPLCAASATALGLPPSALTLHRVTVCVAAQPERFLHAPETPFAWRSAQPRAPPVFS